MKRRNSPPDPPSGMKLVSDLDDLTPDPKNARKHGDRNIEAIVSALREVGAARSIVIDDSGVVRAGNATVQAAKQAGITKVKVVDVDGTELVAVRRSGLTEAQLTRLALFDNFASEQAEGWHVDVLAGFQADGISLDGLWTAGELAAMFAAAGFTTPGLTDPDAVPDQRPTDIRAGDMFELGQHRLLCGDSTNRRDVELVLGGARPSLMVTDPPYGVEYDPEWRKQAGVTSSDRMGKVTNDDRADWSAAWLLFPGDVAYVWHAAIFGSVVDGSLQRCGFDLRSQIIWRKSRFVLSRGHYHWQHEACWYAVRRGKTAAWAGSRNQSTVWNVPVFHRCPACGAHAADADAEGMPTTVWEIDYKDDSGVTTHSTQKPVECMARAMRNHLATDVYEPFSGSGSSLIAAEQLGRRCYAIEIEPGYVQQAIDRWEAFTGRKASKVEGAAGA